MGRDAGGSHYEPEPSTSGWLAAARERAERGCVRGWPADLNLAAGRACQARARGWAEASGGARQPPRPADEAQLRWLRAARRKVAETLQILADAEAMLGLGGGADAGHGPKPGWPGGCDTGGAAQDLLSGGSAEGPADHDSPSEPARELSRVLITARPAACWPPPTAEGSASGSASGSARMRTAMTTPRRSWQRRVNWMNRRRSRSSLIWRSATTLTGPRARPPCGGRW